MTYDPFDTESTHQDETKPNTVQPSRLHLDQRQQEEDRQTQGQTRARSPKVAPTRVGGPRDRQALGDVYDHVYNITKVTINGKTKHQCSCSGHAGGEFRGFCTHSLAAMLHTYKEATGWDGVETTGQAYGCEGTCYEATRLQRRRSPTSAATSAERSTAFIQSSSRPSRLIDQLLSQMAEADTGWHVDSNGRTVRHYVELPKRRRRRKTAGPTSSLDGCRCQVLRLPMGRDKRHQCDRCGTCDRCPWYLAVMAVRVPLNAGGSS